MMISGRLNAVLIGAAALALGAAASSTMAKTVTYYFAGETGGGYCDGLTINDDGAGPVWTGAFVGCSGGAAVGGFRTKIGGLGRFIQISAAAADVPGGFESFLLDTKALKWYLYINDGFAFAEVNAGNLTKKPPVNPNRGPVRSSMSKNPQALDKPDF